MLVLALSFLNAIVYVLVCSSVPLLWTPRDHSEGIFTWSLSVPCLYLIMYSQKQTTRSRVCMLVRTRSCFRRDETIVEEKKIVFLKIIHISSGSL